MPDAPDQDLAAQARVNRESLSLSSQPLFYGKKGDPDVPLGALSPEEFIDRVDGLIKLRGWSDRMAAQMAPTLLQRAAHIFWRDCLECFITPDQFRRVLSEYVNGFKKSFRSCYFQLRNETDLAATL